MLKDLAVCDVDKTLYDATRAIVAGIRHLKLKPTPQLFYAFGCWLLKRVWGREWFSEKVSDIYMSILQENGPERMEAFYHYVATHTDLLHAGPVALMQACAQARIKMVFITGNDANFVNIFLRENGMGDSDHEVFGGEFEVVDGQYTGQAEGSNMGAAGKAVVIESLRRSYPNVPVVLAMGDDEGDLPLFEAAARDGGICVMVGNNSRLECELLTRDFSIFSDVQDFERSSASKKVLRVDAQDTTAVETVSGWARNRTTASVGN